MKTLDQVLNRKKLKLTNSQVTNTLYKFGHITKDEKEYLDKLDRIESKTKDDKHGS